MFIAALDWAVARYHKRRNKDKGALVALQKLGARPESELQG